MNTSTVTFRFFFILPLLFFLSFSSQAAIFAMDPEPEYLPGRIIIKMESGDFFNPSPKDSHLVQAQNSAAARLMEALGEQDLLQFTPVFRKDPPEANQFMKPSRPLTARAEELIEGFRHTYSVRYASDADPMELSREIGRLPGVLYAEPHFIHRPAYDSSEYIPNDPFVGQPGHNYFEYMNFYRAWAVSRGAPDVVIAIIDSGVHYDHPDLKKNLWRNPAPGRANWYFNEFMIYNDTIGWNFWESGDIFAGENPIYNNDPRGRFSTHGTKVAGVAAADTDNGTGMAGTGFHSSYMPVKVGGTKEYPRSIAFGYHGIIYAALNEADVISCSFVGGGNSQFGREAVVLATEMGSVVVAALGNNGAVSHAFPASFEEVISVGGVSEHMDDRLAVYAQGGSNFGPNVDVFAVGRDIMVPSFEYDPDTNIWTPLYERTHGTSFSAPMVSGLAALIKAKYPDWPPQRVALQILSTARSIDEANAELYEIHPRFRFENLFGHGLIDAYSALTNLEHTIRITDYRFVKHDGDKLNIGDSGSLILSGINYGSDADFFLLEIEPVQPGITFATQTYQTGTVRSGLQFSAEFPLTIHDSYRMDQIPEFRITITGESPEQPRLSDILYYERLLFDIVDHNDLVLSVSSDGTLGYLDGLQEFGGIGLIPGLHPNVLSEGGLMISAELNNERVVINQVREQDQTAQHFLPYKNFRTIQRSKPSRNLGKAAFRSSEHPVARGLDITLETFAYLHLRADRTFFIQYHITNDSEEVYRDLHAGLFNSWKFFEEGLHHTGYIYSDNLLYVRHDRGAPYLGIAPMGTVSSALAVDNFSTMTLHEAQSLQDSLSFGTVFSPDNPILDGFTDMEKHIALTSGIHRTSVSGEEVSTILSSGPWTLHPYSTITLGFIYAWGNTLESLREQIAYAREIEMSQVHPPGEYTRTGIVADRLTLFPNYPNPFNNRTNIRFDLMESGPVDLAIYNVLGQRVATLVNGVRESGPHFVQFDGTAFASGVYLIILKSAGEVHVDKMKMIQ